MAENIRWGVYSGILSTPHGVGLIEEESSTGFQIRYSEGQMYPPESWSRDHVEVFDHHLKAVEYYSKHTGKAEKEVLENLVKSFPSILAKKQPAR